MIIQLYSPGGSIFCCVLYEHQCAKIATFGANNDNNINTKLNIQNSHTFVHLQEFYGRKMISRSLVMQGTLLAY